MSRSEGGNKGLTIVLGIILALIVLLGFSGVSTYNGMVTAYEKVESSYGDIETQLQRRADLIPNLISTVKGYMEHENEVIDSITQSREKLLAADNIQEMAEANDQLSSALSNLTVLVENYPDLKSNENFIQLQDELAGTENRIATARKDLNDAVRIYNSKIKRFPGVLFAGMFGFEKTDYFQATEGSEEVPSVEF